MWGLVMATGVWVSELRGPRDTETVDAVMVMGNGSPSNIGKRHPAMVAQDKRSGLQCPETQTPSARGRSAKIHPPSASKHEEMGQRVDGNACDNQGIPPGDGYSQHNRHHHQKDSEFRYQLWSNARGQSLLDVHVQPKGRLRGQTSRGQVQCQGSRRSESQRRDD